MNRILIISLLLMCFAFVGFAQESDSSMAKVIFSTTEANTYILMDDTLEVNNGKIFLADTGVHKFKAWAPKHDVLVGEIQVKNDVHLNRQFVDLEKRAEFLKRRNNDILVGVGVGVTLPILAVLNYDYKPNDLTTYTSRIAKLEEDVKNNVIGADSDLQVAREDYNAAKQDEDDNQKKADFRKSVVSGIMIAEVAALSGYLIYRALGPKLKKKNPLLSQMEMSPLFGFNYKGLGLRYKF